jgi:hypothetical protein
MSQQATGRVTVKLNNEALRSKPGASIQLGGITRTGDVTDQGEFYYSEKNNKAVIKATMPHMSDTDLVALRKFRDGTAQFKTDSGRMYTVANACVADIGDLSNGEVEITIEGSASK